MTRVLGRDIKTNRSGAALVEFSLLMPVIFFLAFGMMEFSRALYQFHVANKGVKAAARYLARIPGIETCPPTEAQWTTAQTTATNIATKRSTTGTGNVTIPNWTSITVTTTCTDNTPPNPGDPQPFRGGDNIMVINVSAQFDFDDLGALGVLGIGDIDISADHEDVYIGG